MPSDLLNRKNLIAAIAGGLLIACSAFSCLGSISILVPPATGYLPPSVLLFSIFLVIIAPILLLIGLGLLFLLGLGFRKRSIPDQDE